MGTTQKMTMTIREQKYVMQQWTLQASENLEVRSSRKQGYIKAWIWLYFEFRFDYIKLAILVLFKTIEDFSNKLVSYVSKVPFV